MKEFLKEINKIIPSNKIYTDELRRLAWGTDAGFYRLIPKVVLHIENESEIVTIIKAAQKHNIPLTFRAAGTSLSGQAISDSVLVVAGKGWEKYEIATDKKSIKLQPGIIGQRVNDILKPFGRKFPPDPASIKSAMVGGIILNNASGMSCGTHENSYKTLMAARLIFTDGTLLDTADENSRKKFSDSHPEFIQKICKIRDRVKADAELCKLIEKKYRIKNVTGLSINPFIEFDDAFDIILHLIVGSEGTLAFLSEATMKTVPDLPCKASAMLYFSSMHTACEAVIQLKKSPVTAVELFDRLAIKSVENKPDAIPSLKQLPDNAAVLLIKTEAEDKNSLQENIVKVLQAVPKSSLLSEPFFATEVEEYEPYWTMRSGIFPTVGSTRPIGTTCLIEDVAFQIDDLPNATDDMRKILIKHGYNDAVIYGHALEGNFHFILNQSFDTAEEIARYEKLMNDVIAMVVDKYGGSLKAEHGTGRNMAPFVRKEWGEKAWNIMKEVKQLFDPQNILNPGVIFNDDQQCHLKNLKTLPQTHETIDKCIECGFCEVNCVSHSFTLSSRQRIVVQREITRLKQTRENPERLAELEQDFVYAGDASCAGDGLCATSCPVDINVGDYIHYYRQRRLENSTLAQKTAVWTADHFSTVSSGLRTTLLAANAARSVIGNKTMSVLAKGLRAASGNHIPLWTPSMPKAAPKIYLPNQTESELKVVYFPSCLNQTMSASPNDPDQTHIVKKMTEFLNKAGYEVIFPQKMNSLCCGTIWESKGFPDIADKKSEELEKALLKASKNGKYPVLCDQSPCLKRMRETMKSLNLFEPVEFIDRFLLDKLDFHPIDEPITIHATCSTIKMGLKPTLVKIAKLCSNNVLVPAEVGCCGFAGDKGFTLPELNAHGLRKLRPQTKAHHATQGFSNSRTCEIGLSTHSGIPYQSIVFLVDKCTTAKKKAE